MKSLDNVDILYEDRHLIAVDKPAGETAEALSSLGVPVLEVDLKVAERGAGRE